MPFMSEAVAYAIWSNQTYQQTGIDDLESVVWVLLWFFFHYAPRDVDNGWELTQYRDDVASRPSMSGEPTRTRLFPSTPLPGSTSRKRSPADSGSSRKRARLDLALDPLMAFFSSYRAAESQKMKFKSGSFPPDLPHGWKSPAVAGLFLAIWSLEGWQVLLPRIPGFNLLHKRLPEETTEEGRMSRFSELVQNLKSIFQRAARQATEYYLDTGNSDQ